MKNLFFLLIAFSVVLSSVAQSVVFVTVTGSGSGSGSSWANSLPGTELANRVSTATSGSQFWVAAGIYKPTVTTNRMASFSIASGVSVFGGFSGTETQLDQRNYFLNKTILSGDIGLPFDSTDHSSLPASQADNSYHVVYFQDVDNNTQLNGLTVSGGVANLANGPTSYLLGEGVQANDIGKTGGGIHNVSVTKCSTPTIINCTIEQNRASFGSGFYSSGLACSSAPQCRIVNCVFRANESFDLGSGGGIYIGSMSNTLIQGCVFADNRSFWGGGIFVFNCNPQLINCLFNNNRAGFNSGGSGGGTFIDAFNEQSSPSFYNCLFTGNQATGGGAVFNGSFFNGTSNPEFVNCSFTQNIASSYSGGAIAIQDSVYSDGYNKTSSANLPHPGFRNCIIWNNTSYRNESISFGFNAYPAIRNTIVGGNFLTQDYVNAPSSYNAGNNLNTDPLFADPTDGNFRLSRQSPAVNAGDPDTSGLPATDLVGQARIQDGRIDLGAYELPACVPSRCVPVVIQRVR
ncbi:choice-of-anchor Q domain-containing protein [Spirosoma sp. SC4-14]|uniref:choice-of-anchor Q domain-containing protein n=1 Tax=Spirosoma sp. SC4-14 TaxID=3128900 RepID=UPI0030D14D81